jgi:hypothetical protein
MSAAIRAGAAFKASATVVAATETAATAAMKAATATMSPTTVLGQSGTCRECECKGNRDCKKGTTKSAHNLYLP